jgi:crotonobetainyl-CoA:carnitine CoA-transferase CaiB-like acyl-CoA transferase
MIPALSTVRAPDQHRRVDVDPAEDLLDQDHRKWLELLLAHGIPTGPVNTIDRVLSDPHAKARGMVEEVHDPRHPELAVWLTTGNRIKMSAMPEESFTHHSALGEHTEEILRDLLSYSPSRVAGLRERKII